MFPLIDGLNRSCYPILARENKLTPAFAISLEKERAGTSGSTPLRSNRNQSKRQLPHVGAFILALPLILC
jgi:hypothetical protein